MPFVIGEIEEVLETFPEYQDDHHLGKPFATAYQIALRFAERFPQHPEVKRLPIGGAGTGQYQSLAQQIARFLSQQLKAEKAGRIEGGFLSHEYLEAMSFTLDAISLSPSTLRTEHAQSLFRLKR